jgi:hypothetical protein
MKVIHLTAYGNPAVTAAPGPAGVRVWQITSWGRGPRGGDRRRKLLMLAILHDSNDSQ